MDLSEEYNINNLKISLEKHLIKNIQKLSTSRLYGKTINDQLDYLVNLLNLSVIYRLSKLKTECINYISKKFDQNQIDKNIEFNKLETEIKLAVFKTKTTMLEDHMKLNEIIPHRFRSHAFFEIMWCPAISYEIM